MLGETAGEVNLKTRARAAIYYWLFYRVIFIFTASRQTVNEPAERDERRDESRNHEKQASK
jgi:hypothetical protein